MCRCFRENTVIFLTEYLLSRECFPTQKTNGLCKNKLQFKHRHVKNKVVVCFLDFRVFFRAPQLSVSGLFPWKHRCVTGLFINLCGRASWNGYKTESDEWLFTEGNTSWASRDLISQVSSLKHTIEHNVVYTIQYPSLTSENTQEWQRRRTWNAFIFFCLFPFPHYSTFPILLIYYENILLVFLRTVPQ